MAFNVCLGTSFRKMCRIWNENRGSWTVYPAMARGIAHAGPLHLAEISSNLQGKLIEGKFIYISNNKSPRWDLNGFYTSTET
jgi:hypothetical protein